MRALTWHGKRDVCVDTVPDPHIEDASDIIVRITSSGLCGSDLTCTRSSGRSWARETYSGTSRWAMVEEVGAGSRRPGDRVVIPFNASCGTCSCVDRGCMGCSSRDGAGARPLWALFG